MILNFADQGTEDIFNNRLTPKARRTLPVNLWRVAQRKMAWLDAAVSVEDLRVPPSNHLEKLRGNREGQYSIRINERYRLCFRWTSEGPEDVEIVDYH